MGLNGLQSGAAAQAILGDRRSYRFEARARVNFYGRCPARLHDGHGCGLVRRPVSVESMCGLQAASIDVLLAVS